MTRKQKGGSLVANKNTENDRVKRWVTGSPNKNTEKNRVKRSGVNNRQ